MTALQKAIKYCAMAFAVFLVVSIIGGIAAGLGGLTLFFGKDDENASEQLQTYTVSGNITEVEIEVSAADFEIVTGESFSVESNSSNLTVEERKGKLIIEEKTKQVSSIDVTLKVTVPKDFVFNKADIIAGAGRVYADSLCADVLTLECGAGEVKIDNAVVLEKAKIEGGIGGFTVSGGSLANLDLEMGVGEMNLTSKLTGSCDLNLGIGETNISLIGSEEDYTIEIDKGIGIATVNGESLSGDERYGFGANRVNIDSGIGAVKIDFAQAG